MPRRPKHARAAGARRARVQALAVTYRQAASGRALLLVGAQGAARAVVASGNRDGAGCTSRHAFLAPPPRAQGTGRLGCKPRAPLPCRRAEKEIFRRLRLPERGRMARGAARRYAVPLQGGGLQRAGRRAEDRRRRRHWQASWGRTRPVQISPRMLCSIRDGTRHGFTGLLPPAGNPRARYKEGESLARCSTEACLSGSAI